MPKTTARPAPPVDVTLSSPAEPERPVFLARLPYLPWAATAVVGALAVVLLGWVLAGAVVAAGWLTQPHLPPAVVLDVIGQVWLGAHGVPFVLDGLTLSVTPLGSAALLSVAMAAVARYAVDQTGGGRVPPRAAAGVAATCTGTYALACWLLASLVGAPTQAIAAFVGGLVVAGVGAGFGTLRAARASVFAPLPRWTRALPRGIAGGLAGLALASVVTLAIAVAAHSKQIAAVSGGLEPDAVGTALLWAVHLAYLPNILLWAGSYALGSGFTVGAGTLVTPQASELGLLPALPVAGALPAVAPPYPEAFLVAGPAAGVVAGLLFCHGVLRHGGALRLLPAVTGSTLAGALAGAAWAAASWVSRGDLGVGRLVGLGPRFPELLPALAPVAVASALTGLCAAWWTARRRPGGGAPDAEGPDDAAAADRPVVRSPFGLDTTDAADAEATVPVAGRTPFGLD